MSAPYGLAADLHFHPWSAFAGTTMTGLNTRLEMLLDELERLAKSSSEAGAKSVVLAGDIFHVRGSVSPTVLNAVRDTLASLVKEYGVEFLVLAGNHDLEGKNSTRLGSAITALEQKGVTIINESTRIDTIVLVPWHESIDGLKAELEKVTENYGAFKHWYDLILHAPIDGVLEGLPAHGLSPEYLSSLGFKRVFAGHYHNHKEFPGSVYSIGALAHHTWSDVGSKAGFLLVSDDDVHWMKSHLPAFVDVDRLVDVEPDELPFMVERNYVRVRVDSGSSAKVAQVREELETMGAAGVLIQAVPKPPVREDTVTATVVAGASLEASIGEYTKKFEYADLVFKEALSVLTAADSVEAS